MGSPQINHCRQCGAPILPVIGRALVTYMFGQTLGIKPRRKSTALPIYTCHICSVVLAAKPSPEENDFYNITAYQILRNLFGMDRPEVQQAFSRFFELLIEREGQICEADVLGLLPQPEPEILLPQRALKAVS
jgi:hypothetical protein